MGGGNSAGQAAVFLAGHARKVLLLIRGDDLYKNMSSYLARRIEQTANIELLCNTTIRRMHGDGHLTAVEIVNNKTGEERTVETPAVFSFIGAVPRTDWLPPEIERDAKGFVQTGPALATVPALDRAAAAVPAGDQPPRRVRRRRRALRLGQARRLGRRRGRDGRPVRARVSEGDVRKTNIMAQPSCTHLNPIRDIKPSAPGCEECLKMKDRWVHLRMCLTCGHGCGLSTMSQ